MSGIDNPVSGGNPTAAVGLAAANGVAVTYLRSDGAPALDQTIAPTWAGQHTWAAGTIVTSKPLTETQTWNAAGVVFTAHNINVTPTAYAATSRFLDLQDAGVSLARFELIANGSPQTSEYARLVLARGYNTSTLAGTLDFLGGQFNFKAGGTPVSITFFDATPKGKFTFDTTAAASGLTVASDLPIGWSSTTTANYANDAQFSYGGATGKIQMGAANAASPVAQTLQAQGSRAGTDSNVAGATVTLKPGPGTGSAVPNPLIINSNVPVGSGTGVQTDTKTISFNYGSTIVGPGAALSTSATDGFLYFPTSAGTPTGTPTTQTGTVALEYDTTNDELEIYSNGQWNGVPISGGQDTAPAGNVTLRANYSLVVIDSYTIAAAKTLTLGAGSRMRMI